MDMRIVAITAVAATVALSGCGSMKESIRDARAAADRAQAAADSAQGSANMAAQQAQAAGVAAQHAQASADQANQKADAVSARVDQFIADQQAAEAARHRHSSGTNMASLGERG